MIRAMLICLFLVGCVTTHQPGDFALDQTKALGPLLRGERP